MLVGVDVETIGLDGPAYAVGAVTEDNSEYCWLGEIYPQTKSVHWTDQQLREMLKVLNHRDWVGHNIGLFDLTKLEAIGFRCTSYIDTLPASHVYNSNESHKLKDLATKYLHILPDDETALEVLSRQAVETVKACRRLINNGRSSNLSRSVDSQDIIRFSQIQAPEGDWQNGMWLTRLVFPEETYTETYVVRDALRALRLWTGQGKFPGYARLLAALKLRKFYDTHIEYHSVVKGIKSHGVRLFVDKAKERLASLEKEKQKIEARFLGLGVSVRSPKQLSELLFTRLGFPVIKPGEMWPSTDKEVINALIERYQEHPKIDLVKLLLDHREFDTDSKYAQGYLNSARDGIIYPDINPTGTGTTRGSCSNPNVQNVSKQDGRSLRDLFGPRDGCWWYLFDYEQLELRILAWMANEIKMMMWLDEGRDVHQFLGDIICRECGLLQLVGTEKARGIGKTLNFLIVYGGGPEKAASTILQRLKVTIKKPHILLDIYFDTFPSIKAFQNESISSAASLGYVFTAHGYKLVTPPGEPHTAVDYRVQGTAGWIAKEAAIRVAKLNLPINLALDEHDALDYEGKKNLSRRILLQVKSAMEDNGLVNENGMLKTPVALNIVKKDWGHKIPYEFRSKK